MCKAAGKAGEPVFVEHEGSYCYCVCSCLAATTLVETTKDFKPIGEVTTGDTVLALSEDGTWKPQPVVFSNGTKDPGEPYPYAIYVALKDGPALICTADHLFMTQSGLKRADRLSPSDRILNKDRVPLEIISLANGTYNGGIHNIVAKEFPDAPRAVEVHDHLINTAGVISGDYFLQLHYVDPSRGIGATPQVGSPEFNSHFGKRADELRSGLKSKIEFGRGISFVPAAKFEPPAGACSFLPRGQDVAGPNTLRPLDDSIPLAMARYLVNHYHTYYPDVTYHIEWNDNTVNAYAWQDNGVKHVALLGGLLRHRAIKIEGAGLVTAHELGHHCGGTPRYPNHPWPSSCEGQADYWGALVAQRVVWFGAESMRQTSEGANQLYDLFANGLLAGNLFEIPTPAAGICGHPPAQCRLDTYRAAMRLDDKPSCAGDPPGPLVSNLRNGGALAARTLVTTKNDYKKLIIVYGTPRLDGKTAPGGQPTLAQEKPAATAAKSNSDQAKAIASVPRPIKSVLKQSSRLSSN
jgi:hypothetical protein